MRKRTPPVDKKKLIVTLVCMALGALLGYIDTLIPPIFVNLPYARVQLALILAALLTALYSPAVGALVWGVRCLTFGLVLDDGYWLLFDALAGAAALVSVRVLLVKVKLGLLPAAPFYGVAYAVVFCCLGCWPLHSAAFLAQVGLYAGYFVVQSIVLFALAYLALRFLPEEWFFDAKE